MLQRNKCTTIDVQVPFTSTIHPCRGKSLAWICSTNARLYLLRSGCPSGKSPTQRNHLVKINFPWVDCKVTERLVTHRTVRGQTRYIEMDSKSSICAESLRYWFVEEGLRATSISCRSRWSTISGDLSTITMSLFCGRLHAEANAAKITKAWSLFGMVRLEEQEAGPSLRVKCLVVILARRRN